MRWQSSGHIPLVRSGCWLPCVSVWRTEPWLPSSLAPHVRPMCASAVLTSFLLLSLNLNLSPPAWPRDSLAHGSYTRLIPRRRPLHPHHGGPSSLSVLCAPWGATLAKCPACVLPALPRPPRRAAYWAGPDEASSLRLPAARPLHGGLRGPASELLGVRSAPCPSGLGSRTVRAQSGLPPVVPARGCRSVLLSVLESS